VFEETPGTVLAVSHSYGGVVVTNAAAQAKNVVGLVYVAAFATEEGEALGAADGESKDSILGSALVPLHYPGTDGGMGASSSRSIPRRSARPSRPTYQPSRRR
jgi:pimeloyl-ACP methyl ester carboxylesterase